MERLALLILLGISLAWSWEPFTLGGGTLDNGTGIISSPFSHPILYHDTTAIVSTTLTNYHSSDLGTGSKQLYSLGWGGVIPSNKHLFSAHLSTFSAFDLYRTMTIGVGYAHQFKAPFSLGAQMSATRLSVDTLWQWAGETEIGVGVGKRKVRGALLWEASFPFGNNAPTRHRIRFVITAFENSLGAQSIQLQYNSFTKELSFEPALSFKIVPWWSMTIALSSAPFFLHLGTAITVKRWSIVIAMSHHNQLGWSQTGAISYRFSTR